MIERVRQFLQQPPDFRRGQFAARLDQLQKRESLRPFAREKYARARTHDIGRRPQYNRVRMLAHLRQLPFDLRDDRRVEHARIGQELERHRSIVGVVVGRLVKPAAVGGRNFRPEPEALRERAAELNGFGCHHRRRVVPRDLRAGSRAIASVEHRLHRAGTLRNGVPQFLRRLKSILAILREQLVEDRHD